MLTLRFGLCNDVIWATARFFNEIFENEWITDNFVKEMIKDVDSSYVLGDRIIDSPILGLISPRELSGGVKTLILINFMPEEIFNGNQLGSNCLKWLLEIGKYKDITVWFGYNPRFIEDTKYGPRDEWFKIRMTSDDGTEEYAYSQRDITNYAAERLTCSPDDISEALEKFRRKLEEQKEKDEEYYSNLWDEKVKKYGRELEL